MRAGGLISLCGSAMDGMEVFYRQQLTDADRRLVAETAGRDAPLEDALGSAELERAVFAPSERDRVSTGMSPFLAFAVAVHRTAAELEKATFVEERWARRSRIPVFDVGALRGLLADPMRRYFLVELLASYTKVVSGVTWTLTARGWRRRRFSELDPTRLAELLEVVDARERPGVYRRLGDLALFLLGVFPDHPPPLSPGAATERLLRLSEVGQGAAGADAHGLMEMLGARWYGAAVRSARELGAPVTADLAVAGYMAGHFRQARRVLNAVTDRYLFPLRDQWFGRS